MKTIVVTVAPDGRTTVRTEGFAGEQCRQASRPLEQALGLRTSETLTAEFHTVGQVGQAQNQSRPG